MILTKRIILDPSLPEVIQDFFQKTLDAFGNELNIIAKQLYTYPENIKGIDGNDSINDVFALIERSYVGIFNNAVVRSFPTDAVLQEFSVYGNQDEHCGRADYLVMHTFNNKPINLIFEAKIDASENKEYPKDETVEYYNSLFAKALGYYEAEKRYYDSDTYIVTITFDWVRDKSLLDAILEENYTDDYTDFYFLYYSDIKQAGLMVYGIVVPQSKFYSPKKSSKLSHRIW